MLLEWPDRAGSWLPPDRLDIAITLAPKLKVEFRHARLTGHGSFAPRVERMAAIRGFLADSGLSEAQRHWMPGDASTRAYERLILGDRHLILMNWPRRPDGPPLRGGRSYSEIAHLADDVVPFVAMAKGLREYGLLAPEIHHADLALGLLVIEDLGDERVVAGEPPAPIEERYEVAVDALLALHEQQLPDLLPVAPHLEYRIPPFDLEAFLTEVELLLDWYLPRLERAGFGQAAPGVPRRVGRGAGAGPGGAADLGAARLSFAQPAVAAQPQGPGAARHPGFPGCRDGAGRLRPGVAAAGCPRRRAGSNRARLAQPLSAPARRRRARFRRRAVHQELRDAGGAARQPHPRHLCATRPARRQAAISASHTPPMGLLAALAGASGAGAAQRLVRRARSRMAADADGRRHRSRHGRNSSAARQRRTAPWCWPRVSAPACGRSTASSPSRWCGWAARR